MAAFADLKVDVHWAEGDNSGASFTHTDPTSEAAATSKEHPPAESPGPPESVMLGKG